MTPSAAASAFWAEGRPHEGAADESGQYLLELLRRAQAPWPEVKLSPEVFVRRLGRIVDEPAQAEALALPDLFLATALAEGLPSAHRSLQSQVMPRVRAALRARGLPNDQIDDIAAQLHADQFVGPADQTLPIARYEGRASLTRWLLVIAARLAARVRWHSAREVDEGSDLAELVAPDDLERSTLKDEAKRALRAALRHAATRLDPEQLALLRLHVTEGLAIDEIARLSGVHRATAARRLERARRDLALNTRRHLAEDLGLPPWQIDSLIRVVRSSFDSAVRVLIEA